MYHNDIKTKKNVYENNANNKGGKNRRPQAPNVNSKKTRASKLIIDSNFTSITLNGWKIWKNIKNRLCCAPANPNDNSRRFRNFEFEPGILTFFEDRKNRTYSISFRADSFTSMLKKYDITKVMTTSPNGEYEAFNETDDGNYLVRTAMICDGVVVAFTEPADIKPIIVNKYANTYFSVTNSTIAILDRIKIDKSTGTSVLFRIVICDGPLTSNEAKLQALTSRINIENDKFLKEQNYSTQSVAASN